MNPLKVEQWLSAALDGELSHRQRERLERYLAAHPELSVLQNQWRALGDTVRTAQAPPEQTPEAAWQDVRRAIRLAGDEVSSETAAMGRRIRWAGAVAVAALLILGLYALLPSTRMVYTDRIVRADRTEVEWVETELPDAMSMVYEHEDTGLTIIWVLVAENGAEDKG